MESREREETEEDSVRPEPALSSLAAPALAAPLLSGAAPGGLPPAAVAVSAPMGAVMAGRRGLAGAAGGAHGSRAGCRERWGNAGGFRRAASVCRSAGRAAEAGQAVPACHPPNERRAGALWALLQEPRQWERHGDATRANGSEREQPLRFWPVSLPSSASGSDVHASLSACCRLCRIQWGLAACNSIALARLCTPAATHRPARPAAA